MPHQVWIAAVPRLLAAAFLSALIVAGIIKLAFRPGRSHMSYRSAVQARHAMSRRR
jgi:hypothetical protein